MEQGCANRPAAVVMISLAGKPEASGPLLPLSNESGVRPGNIGYLRVYSQSDSDLAARIDMLMAPLRETDTLIIDARQCGGGTRECLSALFP